MSAERETGGRSREGGRGEGGSGDGDGVGGGTVEVEHEVVDVDDDGTTHVIKLTVVGAGVERPYTLHVNGGEFTAFPDPAADNVLIVRAYTHDPEALGALLAAGVRERIASGAPPMGPGEVGCCVQ